MLGNFGKRLGRNVAKKLGQEALKDTQGKRKYLDNPSRNRFKMQLKEQTKKRELFTQPPSVPNIPTGKLLKTIKKSAETASTHANINFKDQANNLFATVLFLSGNYIYQTIKVDDAEASEENMENKLEEANALLEQATEQINEFRLATKVLVVMNESQGKKIQTLKKEVKELKAQNLEKPPGFFARLFSRISKTPVVKIETPENLQSRSASELRKTEPEARTAPLSETKASAPSSETKEAAPSSEAEAPSSEAEAEARPASRPKF